MYQTRKYPPALVFYYTSSPISNQQPPVIIDPFPGVRRKGSTKKSYKSRGIGWLTRLETEKENEENDKIRAYRRRNPQKVNRGGNDFHDKRTQERDELQVNDSQRKGQQRSIGGSRGGLMGRSRVQADTGPRGTCRLRSAFEPVQNIQLPSSSARR